MFDKYVVVTVREEYNRAGTYQGRILLHNPSCALLLQYSTANSNRNGSDEDPDPLEHVFIRFDTNFAQANKIH